MFNHVWICIAKHGVHIDADRQRGSIFFDITRCQYDGDAEPCFYKCFDNDIQNAFLRAASME